MRASKLVLFLFIGLLLASYDIAFLTWTMGILAILVNISAVQRIGKALRIN